MKNASAAIWTARRTQRAAFQPPVRRRVPGPPAPRGRSALVGSSATPAQTILILTLVRSMVPRCIAAAALM